MRLVQGQMGIVLADYADRPDESDHRSGSCCRQARLRCDDADEKDRHRCNRGGAPRLRIIDARCQTASRYYCFGFPSDSQFRARISEQQSICAAGVLETRSWHLQSDRLDPRGCWANNATAIHPVRYCPRARAFSANGTLGSCAPRQDGFSVSNRVFYLSAPRHCSGRLDQWFHGDDVNVSIRHGRDARSSRCMDRLRRSGVGSSYDSTDCVPKLNKSHMLPNGRCSMTSA